MENQLHGYRNQAISLLQNEFSGISCQAISLVLQYQNFNFVTTYRTLSTFKAEENHVIRRLPALRGQSKLKIFLKADRKQKNLVISNLQLQHEIETMPEMNRKKRRTSDVEIDEELGTTDDKENHGQQEFECGCCYGDFSLADLHQCSTNQSHRCCGGCVRRYVTEQLDGNNSTNFCCIVDSDCNGVYTMRQLDTLLSPKINRRLNDRYIRAQIEASGMASWVCDKCSYIGALDKPFPKTVVCPTCNVNYCRKCKHPHHPNETCEQLLAEKERLKNPIIRAQEAMSKVTIRACPNCKTPFQKHEGCNKMTCAKCKCFSCYMCKSKVQGYDHFCTKRDCRCNRCHLWENPENADRLARRAAGRKILEDANVDAAEIDKVLGSPPPLARKRQNIVPARRHNNIPQGLAIAEQRGALVQPLNVPLPRRRVVIPRRGEADQQPRAAGGIPLAQQQPPIAPLRRNNANRRRDVADEEPQGLRRRFSCCNLCRPFLLSSFCILVLLFAVILSGMIKDY